MLVCVCVYMAACMQCPGKSQSIPCAIGVFCAWHGSLERPLVSESLLNDNQVLWSFKNPHSPLCLVPHQGLSRHGHRAENSCQPVTGLSPLIPGHSGIHKHSCCPPLSLPALFLFRGVHRIPGAGAPPQCPPLLADQMTVYGCRAPSWGP